MSYLLGGPNSIPGSARFLYSSLRPDSSGAYQASHLVGSGRYSQRGGGGGSRPWRETDDSLPSSAEAKNGGAITPLHITPYSVALFN
jgi:hypothetical protein